MDSFVDLFLKQNQYDDAIDYLNVMQANLSTGSSEWIKVSAFLAHVYILKAINQKEHPDSETVVNAENLVNKIFQYNVRNEMAHYVLGMVFLIKGYRKSALEKCNILMTLGQEGVRLAEKLKKEIDKKRE
jgi:hypothetical protein